MSSNYEIISDEFAKRCIKLIHWKLQNINERCERTPKEMGYTTFIDWKTPYFWEANSS